MSGLMNLLIQGDENLQAAVPILCQHFGNDGKQYFDMVLRLREKSAIMAKSK